MVIINRWFDLINASSQRKIQQEVTEFLAPEFRLLHEHLGDGCNLYDFDLTQHGPMWVITPTDGGLTWSEITRQMAVQTPEFIERHTLTDGSKILRIGFIVDNDCLPMLYAIPDSLEPETAAWLQSEAYEVEASDSCNDFAGDESPF